MANQAGRGVPVRALVQESLAKLREFTSNELVAVVQVKNPQAREDSIRAELMKGAGDGCEEFGEFFKEKVVATFRQAVEDGIARRRPKYDGLINMEGFDTPSI